MARLDLTDNLIKLSDGKLFLLKQVLTLTQQQSTNIDSEEAEKLNEIIEQKQNIMTRIDSLDKEFVEKYDLLKKAGGFESLERLQPYERDKMKVLQDKIAQIYALTEKIQRLDDANLEKLKKNLKSVQGELEKVRVGKKVMQGYSNKSTEGISIFVDKKQ